MAPIWQCTLLGLSSGARPKEEYNAPHMASHYFTVEEANAALVIVRPLVAELQDIRTRILAHRPELWPALERAAGNGGNATLAKMVKEFDRLDEIVHLIMGTGAQIKDLASGLLDFPAWRQDHEVLLCWKHGEPEILYWHETDAGFAGRRAISEY